MVGIIGVFVAWWLRPSPERIGVVLVAFALLGGAAMQRALHGLDASPLGPAIVRHADARLVATLVDDPDAARFDARALVRVDRFDGRGGGHRRVLVEASGDVAGHLRLLAAGERVALRGWFTPLEGFDERWRWKHAIGAFHATDVLGVAPTRSPLTKLANDARELVLGGSEHLGPTDRSLLAGFLLGDTRGVPEALTEQFRAAGLTHLTAVSGENVAFVLALFAPLLRRLGLRGRVLAALALLIVFGTMTRWEPSVLRAIAMAVLALVAGHLGRPAAGVRVLALAATALLLARPVPPAPSRVPVVVRGEPGHHAAGAPDHRAAARSRVDARGARRHRRRAGRGGAGAHPRVRLHAPGRPARQPGRGPPCRTAHDVGSRGRRARRPGPAAVARDPAPARAADGRSAPRAASRWPTSRRGCRWPSTVGRRGVWWPSAPSRRPDGAPRRLRTHARVPVPPR